MMFIFSKNTRILSVFMMAFGLTALIYGFLTDSHSAWPSLMFNNFFFMGIALFAVFFIALQYVSEAAWSIVLKRVPETISTYLPIGGVIMLLIVIAGTLHWHHIYHWMDPELYVEGGEHYDEIIVGKRAYLNIPFFLIRSIVYVIIWTYCGKKLRQFSLRENVQGGLTNYKKSITMSAWFIVFFAVTSSTAAWDWIMSIDTHWFSTIFGWYIFSEWACIGFTTILLLTLYLKHNGYLPEVNNSHIHDLGKWVFAFSLVWTYMWFSQFMLIWYANIPEEVTYYMERWDSYRLLFWISWGINFAFPLVLLMSRDAKRNYTRLIVIGLLILLGHWINTFLLITPGTLHEHGHIGFVEIGMGIGFLGLFIFIVLSNLTKVQLSTTNHPFFDESKHLHT